MNNEKVLISLKDVRKTLLKRTVLDIEQMVIRKSECVVVYGMNGSGKTTLLKVLAGLVAPDTGEFSLNGTVMSWRQAFKRFRRHVVYLHQAPFLFDRSVEDNVAYGLKFRKQDRNQIREQVESALEWSGLLALAKRNAKDLSHGEKQRVALTRARILKPKLLLLDEPTTAMDKGSREQTFSLIQDLANSGNSIYIATHESSDSYKPQRVIEMDKGKLI